MQNRADDWLQKAYDMETLAADATDEETRKMYVEMAAQWRELADQFRRANDGAPAPSLKHDGAPAPSLKDDDAA